MSVRLFAAVDLPDETRTRTAEAVDDFRRRLREAGMDDAFRWVAADNLHLTVRFLGNVPDEDAPRAIAAMRAPLAGAAGRLVLGGLGTFPPRGRPRVLHVSVEHGMGVLRALRDEVDARLAPICQWEPETRPFAPHLTLARARDRMKLNPVQFSRLLEEIEWPSLAFEVARVTLFSSKTLPSGPVYTAEAQAELRSP